MYYYKIHAQMVFVRNVSVGESTGKNINIGALQWCEFVLGLYGDEEEIRLSAGSRILVHRQSVY